MSLARVLCERLFWESTYEKDVYLENDQNILSRHPFTWNNDHQDDRDIMLQV